MKRMLTEPIVKILGGILTVLALLIGGLYAGYNTAPPADLSLGALPGTLVTELVELVGGAVIGMPPIATTTTGSAATLTEKDLKSSFTAVTIGGTANTGANFTYTLPASTSLRSFVPRIGDQSRSCFMLVGTTSSSALIFAGGTGVDLRFASSTSATQALPSLEVQVDKETCINFVRRPTANLQPGSISAQIQVYDDAD